jgi:PST family polysaccharide transporter
LIRRIISSGSYMVSGTLIQMALTFTGNLIVLRMLGPNEFGRFAVTLAALSLVVSFLSLRFNVLIVRTPDADFTLRIQRRYFSGLVIETIVIAGASLAWLIALDRCTALDFLLLAAVVVQNFCGHNRGYWERSMPYRRIAIVETSVVAASQLAGVIVVVVTHDAAALYIREFTAAASLFIGLTAVGGMTWHRIHWLSVAEWRSLLRESGGIWLDSILEGAFQRATIIATGFTAGDRGAGLFSMAQRITLTPHQVLMPIGRIALNWFGRTEKTRERLKGRNALIATFGVLLIAATVGLVAVADALIPWLFGPHWTEAVPVVIAMSGVMIFTTLFEITRGYALVIANTRLLVAGRVAQFGGFAIFGIVAYMQPAQAVEFLGLGCSFAVAMAFATQFTLLRRIERR